MSDNTLFVQFMHCREQTNIFDDLKQREAALSALHVLLRENQSLICEAIAQDFAGQRATPETLLGEFFPLYEELRFIQKHFKKWLKPKKCKTDIWYKPANLSIYSQALGCVGIIAPWNFPLLLSLSPMVAAIAAGNQIWLKLSEYTPHFSGLLIKLMKQYLSDYPIYFVQGDASVAADFSALPFDHLLFTGATAVGKQVMAAASQNLTPLTLELGGKSPVLLSANYPLKSFCENLLRAKLFNAGQICIAPDYLLLPQQLSDTFQTLAKKTVRKFYPNWKNNKDYTYIINAKQKTRLDVLVADALEKGAVYFPLVETAGEDPQQYTPALLLNVNDQMRVMQEEIFGPLLPVKYIANWEEGIAYIVKKPRPLTVYGFSLDDNEKQCLLKKTHSGSIAFNTVLSQIIQNRAPFGGIGDSGFGRYRGRFGVETFSHQKTVFQQSHRLRTDGMLTPPYGRFFYFLLRWML